LQNGDGGFPTFCRGWGTLPFDRSGADLTAHALRALAPVIRVYTQKPPSFWTLDPDAPWPVQAAELALKYLQKQQFSDGSWLPLWFGNQHAPDDINPVYGTARVLAAYRDLDAMDLPEAQRGVEYLLAVQNPDGGWGGAKGCPSSIEETALAIEVLLDVPQAYEAVQRGLEWLTPQVEAERYRKASPIGFYFAKLWYFEKLYPMIFCVAALGRAVRYQRQSFA
jgi:squalene-hopene/tetraprenyl-beta-curcumene cyclase